MNISGTASPSVAVSVYCRGGVAAVGFLTIRPPFAYLPVIGSATAGSYISPAGHAGSTTNVNTGIVPDNAVGAGNFSFTS